MARHSLLPDLAHASCLYSSFLHPPLNPRLPPNRTLRQFLIAIDEICKETIPFMEWSFLQCQGWKTQKWMQTINRGLSQCVWSKLVTQVSVRTLNKRSIAKKMLGNFSWHCIYLLKVVCIFFRWFTSSPFNMFFPLSANETDDKCQHCCTRQWETELCIPSSCWKMK